MRLCEAKDGLNRADDALELFAFVYEVLASGGGDRVEARAPVVFGRAPLGTDVAVEKETLERRVKRAFADLQYVTGDIANALRDAVAVHGVRGQRAEDEEVERAGEQLGAGVFVARHCIPIDRRWEC